MSGKRRECAAPNLFVELGELPGNRSRACAKTSGKIGEGRRQALLRLMLQDPSNLDTAFEYAALSSQVGDYEAAVSTLERMLIFAPAHAGNTVFAPEPMKPPKIPFTSHVGRAQTRSSVV